jgi:hypothetical protein
LLESQRWRLAMVFVQDPGVADSGESRTLDHLGPTRSVSTDSVKVLTVASGIVGVLKYDPLQPRIPWGVPANVITEATGRFATARSARTIRGVLRLYPSGVRRLSGETSRSGSG